MSFLAGLFLFSLVVAIAGLLIVLLRSQNLSLGRGVRVALISLILVTAFHHLVNFLHWSRISFFLDFYQAYVDILLPVIWGGLFYVLWQDSMSNALRQERDKARMYLDIVGVMIVALDQNGRVIMINKKGCEVLGYSEQEILGKEWVDHFIPSTERDRIKGIFKNVISENSPILAPVENRILCRDGQQRLVYWNNTTLKDAQGRVIGTLSAGQDVTEIHRIQEALFKTKAHERALIDNLPHLAWVKDVEGRFILVNQAFAKSCGFDIKEIIGKTDLDIWPKDFAQKYRADDLEVMRTGEKKFVEELIEEKKGRRWFETFKSPILDQKGNVLGTTGIARDVTERKQAEQILKESEAKLRQVIDLVPHFIFAKNRLGEFILVNQAVADAYGTTVSELLGKTDGDFNPNIEEVHHFLQDDNEVMDSGQPKDIPEEKITDAKGQVRYLHTVKIPFRVTSTGDDAVLGVSTDITERKIAAEALRDSEEKYRTLIGAAGDAIFLADIETGYVLDANKKAEDLMGMPLDKIIGLHQTSLHPKGEAKLYREYFELCAHDPRQQIVGFVYHPEKGKIPVQINCAVFELKGRKVIMGIFRDITELKLIEDALRRDKAGLERVVNERTEILGKTLRELEDARRLSDIGALAATVAHELRNPLGVIKTAVYNIKQKMKDDSLDRHLTNIDKKISESELIIKNLLSYAQIKTPVYESVNAMEILNECIEQTRHKFSDSKIEVMIKHRGGRMQPMIQISNVHLNELFTNILDNAYQSFTDRRGKIGIEFDYDEKQGWCKIAIQDNGEGIDKEVLPNIFDPFFTTRARGTGLGLSVCNQIINLYGGRIDIESKKGEGTTVTMALPISKKKG